MEISKLITADNLKVVNTMIAVARQDMIIETAIKALNEVINNNEIEFEYYGTKYGISYKLLTEVRNLNDKLQKAKLGRY